MKNCSKKSVCLFLSLVLALFLVSCTDRLDKDSQTVYNLIANNSYFDGSTDIEVKSGTLSSNGKSAYLVISYVDSSGNNVTGHYEITKNKVTDLQKSIDECAPGDDPNLALPRHFEMAEFNNELDYDGITAALAG